MITFGDLHNQTGMRGPHPLLHCMVCGNNVSANASDYFMVKPSTVLECCGFPMILAVKSTHYRHVEL